MNNTTLKKISYAGIAMQIPKSWKAESAEYDEADGNKSYSLCLMDPAGMQGASTAASE